MPERVRRFVVAGLVVGCALGLAGCDDELYSNMTEPEANQMLSVLLSNGIVADKVAKGKDGFTVSVDKRDMLRAIALLHDRGLPKSNLDSVGKEFQKSGIMSSPFEEHVRYIYALGEDVAQTLSQIDGVVTARVHLVIPEAPQLGQPVKPSSAAVFIKHQPGTDLEFLVPQIRRLVSSAIEGLDYQNVTVVLTEATASRQDSGPTLTSTVEVLPGIAVRDTDVGRFWDLFYAVMVALAVLLATIGGGLYIHFKGKLRALWPSANVPAEPSVEPS